jgi:hypothetical protein
MHRSERVGADRLPRGPLSGGGQADRPSRPEVGALPLMPAAGALVLAQRPPPASRGHRVGRGHDPAVALSIYADVKADELRAVGASLFG